MMEKLTFKQYLESREQLLKAIENTPISIVEYEVHKYCSLTVGEAESEKQSIGLKPKHKILVEWTYDDINHPTPTSLKFEGVKDIDEEYAFSTYWTGDKLQKWLSRHALTGINYSHKV